MKYDQQRVLNDKELSSLDAVRGGVEMHRPEEIAVSSIVQEAVIVDDGHADDLSESMGGKRGQLTPITVRVREGVDPKTGKPQLLYDVIDGFHRARAAVKLGWQTIDAVVVYGCDDEELYDLRVLAASSVKSVSYARVAQWLKNSFSHTDLGKRGFTLSQVVSMALQDSSGKNFGLTLEEVKQAKDWIVGKSKVWSLSLATILSRARAVELADPKLLQMVRVGGGGASHPGEISPARFEAIVFALPGDHEMQRLVAQVVMSYNLVRADAERLANAVASCETHDGRLKILANASSFKTANTASKERNTDGNRQKENDAQVKLFNYLERAITLAIQLEYGVEFLQKFIEDVHAQQIRGMVKRTKGDYSI